MTIFFYNFFYNFPHFFSFFSYYYLLILTDVETVVYISNMLSQLSFLSILTNVDFFFPFLANLPHVNPCLSIFFFNFTNSNQVTPIFNSLTGSHHILKNTM